MTAPNPTYPQDELKRYQRADKQAKKLSARVAAACERLADAESALNTQMAELADAERAWKATLPPPSGRVLPRMMRRLGELKAQLAAIDIERIRLIAEITGADKDV